MINSKLLFVVICLFISSCAVSSRATEKIRLGLSEFPPFVIVQNNKASGIDIELANYIAEQLDLEIEYVECPWKRCLHNMRVGKLDMLPGVLKRRMREEYMHYIRPHYVQAQKTFYLQKESPFHINSYEDLKGLSIGVERGAKSFKPFDSDRSLQKLEVNELIQAIRMTKRGRLDTFIASIPVTDYLLMKNDLHNQFRKSKLRYHGETELAFFTISKKSKFAQKLAKFDYLMEQASSHGIIDKIMNKYVTGTDIQTYLTN
ncbi:MAG: transporter substrate-binding domain-containing protein [Sneathiella sp.]